MPRCWLVRLYCVAHAISGADTHHLLARVAPLEPLGQSNPARGRLIVDAARL